MDGLGLTTILACLRDGEFLMNAHPGGWQAGINKDALYFAEKQAEWRKGLEQFKDELKSVATFDPQTLMAKMAEWGMRITPPPTFGPGAVYMASQLKEKIDWAAKGKKAYRSWPEFKLGDEITSLWSHGESHDPVVVIRTKKQGDGVCMLRWDKPLTGLDILRQIEKIEATMRLGHGLNNVTSGVQIPCVYAVTEPNIDWLLDLVNRDWFIAYAKQRIEFGMNHTGFAQREETVMVTMRGEVHPKIQLPPYLLSENGQSFLFWRRRKGVGFPVSMYQFTQDDFKDPGDLSAIVS